MQRFETKYDLLNEAYKDKQLKKGAILLLQYLVHKADKEQCFPAVETIAAALNVCKRTVQYNMRKLEKAGYIIRKDRWYHHRQLSNRYVFNFGITEDIPGKMKLTEEEYDTINKLSFNNPGQNIQKISEIQKVYKMDLKNRENLLLVYLYHRANKKGIAYDLPEVFMDAIGIRRRSFMHLLHELRNKGLLKVKYTMIRNQEYLIIQLTGEFFKPTEEAGKEVNSAQKDAQEHKPDAEMAADMSEDIQGMIMHTEKKCYVTCNQKIRKAVKRSSMRFRIFWFRFKTKMVSKLEKLKKILRI